MDNSSPKNWKKILGSNLQSRENLQFHVSPDIPRKIFSNCIKSYAKYVTSRGEKILALYDGGRSGKEGFALTELGISFNDPYGNFGGAAYERIESFNSVDGGEAGHHFPVIRVNMKDGSSFGVSFMENPEAAPLLKAILEEVLKENALSPPPPVNESLPLNAMWLELIQGYLPHMSPEGLYKAPYIPDHLLENAIAAYAKDVDQESVAALFEYRTNGHEGFLLTGSTLIYNMGYENWGSLAYDVISEVEYGVQKLLSIKVPLLQIKTRDGRQVELQFIIHPLVARHLHEVLEKGILLNRTENRESTTGEAGNIEEMIERFFPNDPVNRLYKAPGIQNDLVTSIEAAWGFTSGEKILALYDNSPAKTAESGCLLTGSGLYMKNPAESTKNIPWEKLESYRKDAGRHHNNLTFRSVEGLESIISFYLYKKAQDGFLHFLRQSFPDREMEISQDKGETREREIKRHVYTSRRTVSELIPKGVTIILILLSVLLLWKQDMSPFHFLLAMTFQFCLLLLGLSLTSMKKDMLLAADRVKKVYSALIRDIHIKEREPVRITGRISPGRYTIEDDCVYREQIIKEEGEGFLKRLASRFKREMVWQSVPFYIEDASGKVLLFIQDSLVGIFSSEKKELHSGETVAACGTLIKNQLIKEFPEADYALGRGRDFPLTVSDNEKKLGLAHYDTPVAISELAAGWIFIAAGIGGEALLFLSRSVFGQRGIELILDLFR